MMSSVFSKALMRTDTVLTQSEVRLENTGLKEKKKWFDARKRCEECLQCGMDAGCKEIVTLCCRVLDTLHANRTSHHQMKALIFSKMLLSLISVAMALAFSSPQSLYLFSFTISLFLAFTVALP